MKKISLILDLIKNMGIKPIAYRAWHVFKIRSGLIKKDFPERYKIPFSISLKEWRQSAPTFFFQSKETLPDFHLLPAEKEYLKTEVLKIKGGKIRFFSGQELDLGKNYDWTTHPVTGFRYNKEKHWSEIETLDSKKGDIKYVWEKSRFCYIYTLIRYDHHCKEDQSEFVFSEILSWIEQNPVNRGPNFTCSQELSIRILNWIFALYFYRNSLSLTEDRFQKIIHSIYEQTQHVSTHINFSLISVRNNHAITEALLLYSAGILFSFFPESKKWAKKGKKYLEQEGLYQIYPDGSYLQFSFNYERVVIQLYTWAFYLAKANNESFSEQLYERVQKALYFLYQMQDTHSGMLPNYGANDGALFFPLNSCLFRDYRGQLNALHLFFTGNHLYDRGPWQEDTMWFTGKIHSGSQTIIRKNSSYPDGGYFTFRDSDKFSFIRCGKHKDRPSQADNLHLDIWVNGHNILRDAGSYLYNASPEDIRFFMGTSSHNTVMIGTLDQMLKGGRFLWFYWSQAVETIIEEKEGYQLFKGKMKAFLHSGRPVIHERIIKQYKEEKKWEIEDRISGSSLPMKQIWNLNPEYLTAIQFTSADINGNNLNPENKEGYYSPTYGVKEISPQIIFLSDTSCIKTTITCKS